MSAKNSMAAILAIITVLLGGEAVGQNPRKVSQEVDIEVVIVTHPRVAMVNLGLSGGIIGYGRDARSGFGAANLGVELRLSPMSGVILTGEFGGMGGMIDGGRATIWGTGVGMAFWASPHVRLAVGAGYRGVRNESWQFSVGGPQGSFGADFLIGESGLALGAGIAMGPWWDYDGQLNVGWSASAGVSWFFGGPRR